MDLKKIMHDIEHGFIANALIDAKGNHSLAAKLLEINRSTLVMKLKRFGFPMGPKQGGRPKRIKSPYSGGE